MAATAAIVLTLLPMAIPASAEGPQDQGSVESFFDQHIPDALDEWEIPGATVSVVRGNQVLFRGGYGMSDLERGIAFDPDRTLVRIASITKTFTWTSIMQLQERGSVDLDADVNDYLDNVEVPDTFEAPVTLRSLMTHTSGFEDRTIGLATRTPEEMIPLEQYLMENMPERVRPPGVMTSYSNFGAGLAGQVVSDVSGMSYQDYIEANILTPLDMNHTAVVEPLPAELAPDMARSYRKVDGALEAKPTDYDALPPDGVISTTAGDMAKYMMALLAGTQHQDTPILRSATAELMFNDAFVPASGLDGWTLGFKEWTLGGHRAVMHDGGWEEFVSAMILFPDSDLGLFIAFNGEGGAEAMAEVVSDFVAQFLTSEERAPGSGSSQSPVTDVDGFYRLTRSSESTVSKLLTLVGSLRASMDADGSLHFGGTSWAPLGDGLFEDSATGERLAVIRPEEQSTVFLATDRTAYERLGLSDTLPFNLLVLGFFVAVAVSTLIGSGVLAVYRRFTGRESSAPGRRNLAIAASGIGLLFMVLLIAILFSDTSEFLYGAPGWFHALMVLPIAYLGLSIVGAYRMAATWRWNIGAVLGDITIIMSLLALSWFLLNWNLIGWHF